MKGKCIKQMMVAPTLRTQICSRLLMGCSSILKLTWISYRQKMWCREPLVRRWMTEQALIKTKSIHLLKNKKFVERGPISGRRKLMSRAKILDITLWTRLSRCS